MFLRSFSPQFHLQQSPTAGTHSALGIFVATFLYSPSPPHSVTRASCSFFRTVLFYTFLSLVAGLVFPFFCHCSSIEKAIHPPPVNVRSFTLLYIPRRDAVFVSVRWFRRGWPRKSPISCYSMLDCAGQQPAPPTRERQRVGARGGGSVGGAGYGGGAEAMTPKPVWKRSPLTRWQWINSTCAFLFCCSNVKKKKNCTRTHWLHVYTYYIFKLLQELNSNKVPFLRYITQIRYTFYHLLFCFGWIPELFSDDVIKRYCPQYSISLESRNTQIVVLPSILLPILNSGSLCKTALGRWNAKTVFP